MQMHLLIQMQNWLKQKSLKAASLRYEALRFSACEMKLWLPPNHLIVSKVYSFILHWNISLVSSKMKHKFFFCQVISQRNWYMETNIKVYSVVDFKGKKTWGRLGTKGYLTSYVERQIWTETVYIICVWVAFHLLNNFLL